MYNMRKQLLDMLETGRENAKSREFLSTMLNISDRKLRNKIEELRVLGHWVVVNMDKGGYYITEDKDELDKFIRREIESRIKSLERVKYGMLRKQ